MRWMAAFVMLAAACGDGDTYDGLLKPPPGDDGMQLSLSVHVEPGQEITACKNFPIKSGTFDIGRFEHAMTAASHHLLVFPVLLGSNEVTDETFTDCDENADAHGDRIGFVYGTQSPRGDLELPKGVAFGAMTGIALQVEFHIFNAGDEAVDAEGAINLWRTREDIVGDAGTVFAYNTNIAIAPMSTGSARQRCKIVDDIELMSLVPHMHNHGTAMQVFVDHGNGLKDLIVDAHGWDEDTVTFDPPVSLKANDVLDIRCDYNNSSSAYVWDGSSAKVDEMCVAGGLYYRYAPRLALEDEICIGEGLVYSGTNSCYQIEACDRMIDYANQSSTPSPFQKFELCVNTGCQSGAQAYIAFDGCRWEMCRSQCYVNATDTSVDAVNFDSTECQSCLATSCAAKRDACAAATCP